VDGILLIGNERIHFLYLLCLATYFEAPSGKAGVAHKLSLLVCCQ